MMDGDRHLDRIRGSTADGRRETRHQTCVMRLAPCPIQLSMGRRPRRARIIKDRSGLGAEDLVTSGWPLARSPYLLERLVRSLRVGDVRGGNITRVASAVGEDRLPSPLFKVLHPVRAVFPRKNARCHQHTPSARPIVSRGHRGRTRRSDRWCPRDDCPFTTDRSRCRAAAARETCGIT